jgi:hypothetical protein
VQAEAVKHVLMVELGEAVRVRVDRVVEVEA